MYIVGNNPWEFSLLIWSKGQSLNKARPCLCPSFGMTFVPTDPALAKEAYLVLFGHAKYSATLGYPFLPFFLHGTLYPEIHKVNSFINLETFSAVSFSVDCPQSPHTLPLPGWFPCLLHCPFCFLIYNVTWLKYIYFLSFLFISVHVVCSHMLTHPCGSQKATFGSPFPPSTVSSGDHTEVVSLMQQGLSPPEPSHQPIIYFFSIVLPLQVSSNEIKRICCVCWYIPSG